MYRFRRVLLTLSLALIPAFAGSAFAQSAAAPSPMLAPEASEPIQKLNAIMEQLQAKASSGEATSAEDFAPEVAALEELLASYEGQVDEDIARIAMTVAMVKAQLGADLDTVVAQLESVTTTYPGTQAAAMAGQMLQRAAAAQAKEAAAAKLVGSPAPEIDFTWSTHDGLTKLSDLKGKVVVLDFWATWCGPCIRSFPQVAELTAHYAGSPVEVVGVTSLQGKVHGLQPTPIDTAGDPEREHELMNDFIAAKDITWTIVFSEQEVFNDDYGVTGIPHMAIIAPDGTVRHSGLHPAMPHDEKTAMIDAILEEFGLPVPTSE
ncbi:TlpA family protein disulfide reductase [Actomonas aquatica]|uniref:TlpA disulfide reductase family protein n=1 Tax=Actomonas aquatica TaxID=2866162 RepID=A0ABZ1C6Y8_9BACT|nr:TlpA disulfide reductase family protein [Opitutus sp. WL0086]WRQ87276.1 TlpA disulfide reductase family protein [Opitutus sp. WL0086]